MFERYRYTIAAARHRLRCCCRSRRSSAARSTARRLWVGARFDDVRAERGRQGVAGRVLRRVSRRQARAADPGPDPRRALVTCRRCATSGRCSSRGVSRCSCSAYEKDIGTSLLFFGVFAAMLYMATRRGAYVVGALILLVIGACVAYNAFGHVRVRVDTWLDPWQDPSGHRLPDHPGAGTRSVRAGSPAPDSGSAARGSSRTRRPTSCSRRSARSSASSARSASRARSCCSSAARTASRSTRCGRSRKLFAAGIATILGFQTFLIIGGVTRVIPLTGITLPFVSYGGSSLVANFALLAILLAHLRRHRAVPARGATDEHRHPPRRHRHHAAVRRPRRRSSPTSRSPTATKLADDPHNTRKFLQRHQPSDRGPIVIGRRRGRSRSRCRSTTSSSTSASTRPRPPSCSRTSSATSRSSSDRSGVEAEYSTQLAGRTFKLQLSAALADDFATLSSRSAPSCSTCRSKAPAGRGRARCNGQRGIVVVLDVRTGRRRRGVLEPDLRPEPARVHDTKIAAARPGVPAGGARQPDARPRVARALPARLDVQDRDRVDRARRQRRRRQAVPVPHRAPAPADDRHVAQLRRRALRRQRSRRASSCRATRPSDRSASTSATSSRPVCAGSACRRGADAPLGPRSRRSSRSVGPAPGHVPAQRSPGSRRLRSGRARSRSRRSRWRSSPRRSRPAA